MKFVHSCKKEKPIRKFLQFKAANKRFKSSEANLSFQRRFLNQEISIKHKIFQTLNKAIISMKNNSPNKMSLTDYVDVLQNF